MQKFALTWPLVTKEVLTNNTILYFSRSFILFHLFLVILPIWYQKMMPDNWKTNFPLMWFIVLHLFLYHNLSAHSICWFGIHMTYNPGQNCWHIPPPPHPMLVNAQFRSKFVSWPLDCRTNIEPGGGGWRTKSFGDHLEEIRCVWLIIFRKMDKIKACGNTFCPGL